MLVLVLAVGLGVFDLIALTQIISKAGYSPWWIAAPVVPVVCAIATWVALLQDNADLATGRVDASSFTHSGGAVAVLWGATLATTFGTWVLFVVFAFSQWPIERRAGVENDEGREEPLPVLAGAARRSARSAGRARSRTESQEADLAVAVAVAEPGDPPVEADSPLEAQPRRRKRGGGAPRVQASADTEVETPLELSEPADSHVEVDSPGEVSPRRRQRGGGAAARRGKHVARPLREAVVPVSERPREPGWYPVDGRPNEQRYWDGKVFTAFRRWSGARWVETPIG